LAHSYENEREIAIERNWRSFRKSRTNCKLKTSALSQHCHSSLSSSQTHTATWDQLSTRAHSRVLLPSRTSQTRPSARCRRRLSRVAFRCPQRYSRLFETQQQYGSRSCSFTTTKSYSDRSCRSHRRCSEEHLGQEEKGGSRIGGSGSRSSRR